MSIAAIVEIVERTPRVLRTLLEGLSEPWIRGNEGGESWSPFDVVGHLIHGERADWIPRARIMLSDEEHRDFATFDRFAQFAENRDRSLEELLDTFAELRADNVKELQAFRLTNSDLARTGIHPEFGEVTLGEHLSTWAVHDLAHLGQITRVMAKQALDDAGPWRKYLSRLES